ncbi:MAG: UDP-2,4-diacetamido-2,4,6-trideoxy-beta-L-altropyranose hydrolase, partial [Caulobacteraceae bacterium]
MRICIRTDASVQIGTGHLRRCLELARELTSRGDDVTFLTRNLGLDCQPLIADAGFRAISLPAPEDAFTAEADVPPHAHWAGVSWEDDASQTIAALARLSPAVVIIDHYAFDYRWHAQVKKSIGCRIVALDDLGDRALDVDLIVDHNYSGDHWFKHRISRPFRPAILGGPTFALLSTAYRNRPEFRVREVPESVGIFMGGSDSSNHSEFAAGAVRQALGPDVFIEIVTTSANPHVDRLRSIRDERVGLSVDLPDLAAFFQRHALQVGAGGGATWERSCIGAPTIAIAFADNHRPVLSPLDVLGVLAYSAEDVEGTQHG